MARMDVFDLWEKYLLQHKMKTETLKRNLKDGVINDEDVEFAIHMLEVDRRIIQDIINSMRAMDVPLD